MKFEDAPSSPQEIARRAREAERERTGQTARARRTLRVSIYALALVCLVLLLVRVMAARQPPPPPSGVVSGVVVDESERPIQVEVVVIGADVSTQTDAQGRFELRGAPAGEREIAVLDVTSAQAFPVVVPADGAIDVGTLQVELTRVPDA